MKREDEFIHFVDCIAHRLKWIMIWAFVIAVSLFFTWVHEIAAAEIVYYDDDSDTIVIREWSCLRWNVDPDTLKFTQSCDISIYCIDGVYDTVTYVRKEAEIEKGWPYKVHFPHWDDVDLYTIPADTLMDIPYDDAPTHYFVDTVITHTIKPYCDTLYDTTFVYEVE